MITIQERRKELGLTQQEMSVLMSMGLSTYQKKEQGIISWLIPDFIKIRKILEIDLEDIQE